MSRNKYKNFQFRFEKMLTSIKNVFVYFLKAQKWSCLPPVLNIIQAYNLKSVTAENDVKIYKIRWHFTNSNSTKKNFQKGKGFYFYRISLRVHMAAIKAKKKKKKFVLLISFYPGLRFLAFKIRIAAWARLYDNHEFMSTWSPFRFPLSWEK